MSFQFSNIQNILLGGIVKTSDLLKRYQITRELCTLHLVINLVGILELISVLLFRSGSVVKNPPAIQETQM